ncbi:MAG: GIY-YIG nuclease family protein [Turicibacter sp.]
MEKRHYIYIVECVDGTLYTGYATDPDKRVHQHNHSKLGAKYTRTRRPVVLRYTEVFETRSEACKREFQIKQLPREAKRRLIDSQSKTIK